MDGYFISIHNLGKSVFFFILRNIFVDERLQNTVYSSFDGREEKWKKQHLRAKLLKNKIEQEGCNFEQNLRFLIFN